MNTFPSTENISIWLKLVGVFLMVMGLVFVGGGLYLIILGGSFYYLPMGIACLISGLWIFKGQLRGAWLYLVAFSITLLWSMWETSLDFWGMVPRVAMLLGVAFVVLFLVPLFRTPQPSKQLSKVSVLSGGALVLVLLVWLVSMMQPHGVVQNAISLTPGQITKTTADMAGEWRDYGHTGEGTRYVPFEQINKDNVDKLEVLWSIRHGDISEMGNDNQNTPLYVDGIVYHCSQSNILSAIDGTNGKILWQFDPKAKAILWNRCRTVAYYEPDDDQDPCGPRLIMATIDSRMIAIRKDGKICTSFGENGTIDLTKNIGEIKPGYYIQTSGAVLAGDKVLIGGWVADNMEVDEPSGVVRAYDATSGALVWAWDAGNRLITKEPPSGDTYTRGTPNVWSLIAYDLELGLAYLPTGNSTPDYWGGKRLPATEKYSSAIVALDLQTGKPRWSFQTVHHDLWDYDVPSQPVLANVPNDKGEIIPSLIQLTKRGQIFVLDRRTGEPVTEVEERPVMVGNAQGERYSKTQPYSVGMPSIGTKKLEEHHSWGMTPLDHLYCRIQFKRHIYHGEFTPPQLNLSLQYPGAAGGFNWGSGSYDQGRNLLILNDIRMPTSNRLLTRDEVDKLEGPLLPHGTHAAMKGTPYGFFRTMFMSPLFVPCIQPPYGTMIAIDLASRKVVWERPMGTSKEVGPLGIRLGIPFEVGMPTLGGSITTKSGLTFFSGTQDYYLRALDTETGDILWKGKLPTGSQATPISYIDKKTGRQIILVNAGGAPYNANRGDYLIAYGLPKQANK